MCLFNPTLHSGRTTTRPGSSNVPMVIKNSAKAIYMTGQEDPNISPGFRASHLLQENQLSPLPHIRKRATPKHPFLLLRKPAGHCLLFSSQLAQPLLSVPPSPHPISFSLPLSMSLIFQCPHPSCSLGRRQWCHQGLNWVASSSGLASC